MLHLFFKWRYERNSRKGAFKLPKEDFGAHHHNPNLNDYISRGSPQSNGFRHYDLPKKRKRLAQIIAAIVGICILAWITYESLMALATVAN